MNEIRNLINKLNYLTEKYNKGYPEVTDLEWDNLYFKLLEMERESGIFYPDSPTQTIYFQNVNILNKVFHNHPMLSLAKTKDWNEFLQYFGNYPSESVTGMVKLDGLTCSLTYQNGFLIKAETRGNGEVGEDILHNAKVIPSIPQQINYKDELIIDGEIICKFSDFEKFKDSYANPRNFASGSIRLLNSKECFNRKLTFVVWNIIKGLQGNSFLNKLQQIQDLGFLTVPWTSSFDWDAKEFLIEQAQQLEYPIDGLVGRFDNIEFGESLGSTGHHARAAYAFKFYDEEYETDLLNIEWTMGRTGVLTPVAIFNPIDDGESIIERASLHNVSIMKQILGTPFYLQSIKVIKANQIIPQVVSAEDGDGTTILIPEFCPICGKPTKIIKSDSEVENLICSNPNCEGKLINILDHFCGKKGLDIRGLSKMTLEKLINWGWISNISDIYSLNKYRIEWIQKLGFGEKSVQNILDAIENSKKTELSSFITAIGIPLVGNSYAKEICKNVLSWEDFRNKIKEHFDFTLWNNFGVEICRSLWFYDYTEADNLIKILTISNSLKDGDINNLSLKDISICITGKLNLFKNRAELQSLIEKNGGKVVGSISKNTSFLINNDVNSTSTKNIAANKLGIPIISEERFKNLYLKN